MKRKFILALALAAGALALGGCAGGAYYTSTYPDYRPYYGYYGYAGGPFYGYPGYYRSGVVISGRTYTRGYGRHHFGRDWHRGRRGWRR